MTGSQNHRRMATSMDKMNAYRPKPNVFNLNADIFMKTCVAKCIYVKKSKKEAFLATKSIFFPGRVTWREMPDFFLLDE